MGQGGKKENGAADKPAGDEDGEKKEGSYTMYIIGAFAILLLGGIFAWLKCMPSTVENHNPVSSSLIPGLDNKILYPVAGFLILSTGYMITRYGGDDEDYGSYSSGRSSGGGLFSRGSRPRQQGSNTTVIIAVVVGVVLVGGGIWYAMQSGGDSQGHDLENPRPRRISRRR